MATKTVIKEEALRVLRNVLGDIAEVWRAYSDETYDYWEASLKHADFLFGLYEKSLENPEEAETLDLSSAINELLDAVGDLRKHESDEDGCENVCTEAIGLVEEAVAEIKYALNALSEDVK